MVPGPASPTSLLWAHQLKREHAFLLARIKAVEDKHVTAEKRDDALRDRVEATERLLARRVHESEGKERASEQANGAISELQQDRQRRETDRMVDKLDGVWSALQDLGAKNERCIFTLYTAMVAQTGRQGDVSEQLKRLESGLAGVKEEMEKMVRNKKDTLTDPRTLRKSVNSLKENENDNFDDEIKTPEKPLRRKDDAADAVVLARRVEALEARRSEDNATINSLRQRMFELERAMKGLNHEGREEARALMRTKDEMAFTPPLEKPLSQVTTEIQTTTSIPSQFCATMSSPLQDYTRRESARYGRHVKQTQIIMPLMNESVAKATLKGPRIVQDMPVKIQPNATRKRRALTPALPSTRETRSKARLSRHVTEQKRVSTNEQIEDSDKGPVCKDSQPSRDRKRAKETQPAQQSNKKRRQILQVCELEEPD